MNKVLITFLVLMIHCNLSSQNYSGIADSTNIWTVVKYYRTSKENCETYQLKLRSAYADSSSEYLKIIRSDIREYGKRETEIGLLREDNIGNVFFRKENGNELLLYSFDVKVNDTISVHNPLSYYEEKQNLIVDSVCNVLINGINMKRIVLKLECDVKNARTIWLEGIGDLKGLLSNTITNRICGENGIVGIKSGLVSEKLSCFEKNSIIIYQNPDYKECIKNGKN